MNEHEAQLDRIAVADWDTSKSDRPLAHSQQENLFSIGFGMFVLANWLFTYQVLVSPKFVSTKADPNSFAATVFAVMQTVGLTIMTLADVDANAFLARNRVQCKGFVLAWGLAYLASVVLIPLIPGGAEYETLGFSAAVLPFVYLLAKYEQVVSESEGYPRLTEIFTVVLSQDLVAHAIFTVLQYMVLRSKPVAEVPWAAVFVFFPVGSGAVVASYRWSRRLQHESHTVSFKTATCIFLLAYGTGVSLSQLLSRYRDNVKFSIGAWLMGPIHIVPSLFVLGFRKRIMRWLGVSWLSRRGGNWDVGAEMGNLGPRRGNLVEVEEAISAQVDLNRFVHISDSDDFTLLCVLMFSARENLRRCGARTSSRRPETGQHTRRRQRAFRA